jgi:hypothetical protein
MEQAIEWVLFFNPIATEQSELAPFQFDYINCLNQGVFAHAHKYPIKVSLIFSHGGHVYEFAREATEFDASTFPNSTFHVFRDGEALNYEEGIEVVADIFLRSINIKSALNSALDFPPSMYEEDTSKSFGENHLSRLGHLFEIQSSPLVLYDPFSPLDCSYYEEVSEILGASKSEILIFIPFHQVWDGKGLVGWVSDVSDRIGLMCLLFQNGLAPCSTIHWGENPEQEGDWINEVLACGDAFYTHASDRVEKLK